MLTQDRNEGSSQRGLVYKAGGWERESGETGELSAAGWGMPSNCVTFLFQSLSQGTVSVTYTSGPGHWAKRQDSWEFF